MHANDDDHAPCLRPFDMRPSLPPAGPWGLPSLLLGALAIAVVLLSAPSGVQSGWWISNSNSEPDRTFVSDCGDSTNVTAARVPRPPWMPQRPKFPPKRQGRGGSTFTGYSPTPCLFFFFYTPVSKRHKMKREVASQLSSCLYTGSSRPGYINSES